MKLSTKQQLARDVLHARSVSPRNLSEDQGADAPRLGAVLTLADEERNMSPPEGVSVWDGRRMQELRAG